MGEVPGGPANFPNSVVGFSPNILKVPHKFALKIHRRFALGIAALAGLVKGVRDFSIDV
jgi:hypothetical protein